MRLRDADGTRSTCAVFAALLVAGLVCACGGEVDETAPRVDRSELLPRAPGEVVARVDGAPITDAQVEAALARAPEGTTEEEALAALVEQYVVAAKAREAGVDEHLEVRLAQHRALGQRLLEEEIESVRRADVPADIVRSAYDEYAFEFFVPELVTASHVLVEAPAKGRSEARLAAARALASEIRAELLAVTEQPPPDAALTRLAALANRRGFVVRAEHRMTFPRHPIEPMMGQRPRYPSMVEPFAAAAFALSANEPVSEPIVTRFGVHVIVFRDRTPGSRPPFEEVDDMIREELLQRRRARMTKELLQRLRQEATIELDEGPVEALAERASTK